MSNWGKYSLLQRMLFMYLKPWPLQKVLYLDIQVQFFLFSVQICMNEDCTFFGSPHSKQRWVQQSSGHPQIRLASLINHPPWDKVVWLSHSFSELHLVKCGLHTCVHQGPCWRASSYQLGSGNCSFPILLH